MPLDVGGAGGEDPDAAVDAAAVEHLDQHLQVRRGEEPEEAAVAGHRQRAAAARAAEEVGPADLDGEAAAEQAEASRRGGARGRRLGGDDLVEPRQRRGRLDDAVAVDRVEADHAAV